MLVRYLAIAVVVLATLATPTQDLPTASASNGSPQQVPGLRLRVGDSIDDLDFVIDDDGALTLAWLASLYDDPNDHSRVRTDVWVSRREREGSKWTEPALIASKVTGPIRVLASENRLHVLVGRKLRHFSSRDRGRTWSEYPQLVGPEAQVFDATVDRNSLAVAYLASLPRAARSRKPDSVAVWTVKWSERAGAGAPVKLGTFPGSRSFQPEPKLLRVGPELRVFFAVNSKAQSAVPGVDPEDAGIFVSRSTDDGATWSHPQRLATLGMRSGRSRAEGSGYVSHLDAVHQGKVWLVFYNAHPLYVLRSRDGSSWSVPSDVAPYNTEWLGLATTSSVSVATWGAGGRVLWIDERFRRTDRTASNPWGFPWFLDPDWSNNDVLALPIRKILDSRTVAPAQPARLTDDLTYATRVRVRAGGAGATVIWAGREKVGKDLHSYGKPPTIFYLPLLSDGSTLK